MRRSERPTEASRAARRTRNSVAHAYEEIAIAAKTSRRAARKHGTTQGAHDYRTTLNAAQATAEWLHRAQADCAKLIEAATAGEDEGPPDPHRPPLPFTAPPPPPTPDSYI